jgi:hypothetical protein
MEKRGFYLVVLIDEDNKPKKQKSSMTTQMLFMLTAKSGDERAKWLFHLQSVAGTKTNIKPCIDIDPTKTAAAAQAALTLQKQISDSSIVSNSSSGTFDTAGLDSNKNIVETKAVISNSITDDEKLLRSNFNFFQN